MQSKLLSVFVVCLVVSNNCCWAQKGGSAYNLANQSKSPARQIQSSRPLSSFGSGAGGGSGLSSGPSTSSLSSSGPSSFSAPTPLAQQQEGPESLQQSFDDRDSAALAANTRGRPGGAFISVDGDAGGNAGPSFSSGAGGGSSFSSGGGGGGGEEEEGHPAPEPYSFSYSVNDEENGSEVSREESQDAAGNIVGFYHIRDAEGRMRRVDYTAGPEGFRATIRSNEEGLANKDSADAKYEVDEVPAERQAQAAAAAQSRAQAAGRGTSSFGGSSGGGASSLGGGTSSFSPASGSGPASIAASFGEDQSAYALAAGQRRKPVTSSGDSSPASFSSGLGGPLRQIQQENLPQDDFDDNQSPPPQTISRIPTPAQQPSRPQPPPQSLKRPSLPRPQSQPSFQPSPPAPQRSPPSFSGSGAKRPLSSPGSSISSAPPSPSTFQSARQPFSSRPIASKSSFGGSPSGDQVFEQQKNEEVPVSQSNRPSFPSMFSSSPPRQQKPGSSLINQRPQPQRLEQQRQPFQQQYDEQDQQQEIMQLQQAHQTKRWALPLNFFLPQAYRS